MPVIYKTMQSALKTKEGELLYHPRVVYTGTVNIDQIAREVAAYSSLTPGDVRNTIHNMVTVMTQHIHSSEIVMLDEFGAFRLVFRSRGKGAKTKEEVDASQSATVIRFTPASTRNSDHTVATRSLLTGARFTNIEKQLETGSTATNPGSGSEGGSGNEGGSGSEGGNPLG